MILNNKEIEFLNYIKKFLIKSEIEKLPKEFSFKDVNNICHQSYTLIMRLQKEIEDLKSQAYDKSKIDEKFTKDMKNDMPDFFKDIFK